MDDLTTGLESQIAKKRHQPLLTRSTGIMAALVIACLGFVGGIKAQQSWGATPTSATPQTGNVRPSGFTGLGNAANTSSTPTTGKVKLVDGTTVYIETTDGRVITVKTGETTVVQSATTIALKDLQPGTEVSVAGAGGGTDTVTASTITAHK
jgi:hypothetical protein